MKNLSDSPIPLVEQPMGISTLSFLVPCAALPGEGDDAALPALPAANAPRHRWLEVLESMVGPRALRFAVDAQGVRPAGPHGEGDATLTLARLSRNAAGDAPILTAGPLSTMIEWTQVLAATARQTESDLYLGDVNETVRIFIAATRDAALEACAGLSGQPLPLFTLNTPADGSAVLSFVGLLLAPEDELQCLRQEIPNQSWTVNHGADATVFMLVDESEVEGHGLREALTGAALMAMVLSSAPSANAGALEFFGFKSSEPISQVATYYGLKGEVLPVKSQKLQQPAPRIYDRNLAASPNAEHLVVVDVSAQRAYLFVNGCLVFDTPVSTAAKGHVTPRGSYTISEKVKTGKHSTLYGSPMPYWQRLGESAVGMHTGQLPGYPASHGCIRMPDESAHFMFDSTTRGTTVQVVNHWTPPAIKSTMIAKS